MLISSWIVLEKLIWLLLSRVSLIGVIEEFLNANEDLLDGNGGLVILSCIKNRKTHCSRWINIRVEKTLGKFHLWRLHRIVLRELHANLKHSSFPRGVDLSWDLALPLKEILCAVRVLFGTSNEAGRVVLSPGLSFFCKAATSNSRHFD